MTDHAHWMFSSIAMAVILFAGCDGTSPADPSTNGSVQGFENLPSAEALTIALSDPDPFARARNLGILLPTLEPDAAPEVRKALGAMRLDLGAVEFDLLLRFWATHEPAEATHWTFKKASPAYRSAGARTVIEIWAEADPAAALVAAESAMAESDQDVARIAQTALVHGWFKTDRPALERYIYSQGGGIKRQRSLFSYALALTAAEGSESAVQWAQSIPTDDARYKFEVNRQVMATLTWADSDAASRFCEAECDGPFGKGLRNILIRTRLRDGDYGGDVVEWVAQLPDGDEENQANKLHSLWVSYSTWAYRDHGEAIAWMRKKIAESDPPEAWVRYLYGEFARQLAKDDPAEAIEWGEKIEDPVDRHRTLVRVARLWRVQDEAAAEAWLSQSALSEDSREQARQVDPNAKNREMLGRRKRR